MRTFLTRHHYWTWAVYLWAGTFHRSDIACTQYWKVGSCSLQSICPAVVDRGDRIDFYLDMIRGEESRVYRSHLSHLTLQDWNLDAKEQFMSDNSWTPQDADHQESLESGSSRYLLSPSHLGWEVCRRNRKASFHCKRVHHLYPCWLIESTYLQVQSSILLLFYLLQR